MGYHESLQVWEFIWPVISTVNLPGLSGEKKYARYISNSTVYRTTKSYRHMDPGERNDARYIEVHGISRFTVNRGTVNRIVTVFLQHTVFCGSRKRKYNIAYRNGHLTRSQYLLINGLPVSLGSHSNSVSNRIRA